MRNGVSSWRDVISGVPQHAQGTILGPMFFLFFVNDMPDVVSSTAKMFAHDTKLYRNIYSANDCKDLQEDLNALSAWSHHWLLRFNASKCVTVRFRSAFHYVYSLNGSWIYLEEASEQKDSGVLISNDLKPSRHICNVCKRAITRGLEWLKDVLVSSPVRRFLSCTRPSYQAGDTRIPLPRKSLWTPQKLSIAKLDSVQVCGLSLNFYNNTLRKFYKFSDSRETWTSPTLQSADWPISRQYHRPQMCKRVSYPEVYK